MTEHLFTGDHVVVLATGERCFVTGYYLPGTDVRVLLPSGRFATFSQAELGSDDPLPAPGAGDLAR
jgi:hypothetical protein